MSRVDLLDGLGEDFAIGFLKGLPRTITELELDMPPHLNDHVWELLPPHLESLAIPRGSSPLGHPSFGSLTHLDCYFPTPPPIPFEEICYSVCRDVSRMPSFNELAYDAWTQDPPSPSAYAPIYLFKSD